MLYSSHLQEYRSTGVFIISYTVATTEMGYFSKAKTHNALINLLNVTSSNISLREFGVNRPLVSHIELQGNKPRGAADLAD